MIGRRAFRTSCWANDTALCWVSDVVIAHNALHRDQRQRYEWGWDLRSTKKIKREAEAAHLVL